MCMRSNPSWLLVPVVASFVALGAQAAQVEPPKVPVVDRNGVNMANGQVTTSTFTVGIGGAMGLSHNVSVHANEFNGFNGKYNGYGNNVELSTAIDYSPRKVYRIFDFDGTVDFAYVFNGAIQQSGDAYICGPGFEFKSLGDEREILECDSAYLYWTKPDGTVSRFSRSDTYMSSFAWLVDVKYPNGFKVTVQSGMSATTNTGFQVKSIYEPDHRDFRCSAPNPIQGCKNDITTLINTDLNYTNHTSGWSTSNPRYIKAINNAVEYCAPTAPSCVLTKQWPTATFNWAAGMPRTLKVGNTTISIVDMTGKTTWYDFKAYDLAYETLQGGAVAMNYTLDKEMSPRLVGIRSNGNDRKFTYDYTNVFITQDATVTTWDIRLQTSGKIISAKLLDSAETGYQINQPYFNDAVSQAYGIGGIHRVQVKGSAIQGNPGAIYLVESDDGVLERENTVTRNFPVKFSPANGPTQDFEYFRSNLKKIIYRKNQADSTYVEATFPTTCTSTTRKTCNQATSIRDARGNYTHYTYHEPSGGVYSVTYPPNKNGKVAQTRYEYEQKTAHYYKGGAGKETGDPIWMKVSERYCINSDYVDSSADGNPLNGYCQDGDEVITRFEYNHDNLLMTGMTVTSPPSNPNSAPPYNTTLRTCFRYDMYGNQIGKTEPNANLSSCP